MLGLNCLRSNDVYHFRGPSKKSGTQNSYLERMWIYREQGYVEVQLDNPGIATFREDVLMLVTDNSRYTERAPIAVGTLHIDRALDVVMGEEIKQ